MLSIDLRPSTTVGGYSYYVSPIDERLLTIGTIVDDEVEIPNSRLVPLMDILISDDITSPRKDVLKKLLKMKPKSLPEKREVVLPKFKLQPRPHQVEAIKFAVEKERFLNCDEMGLGKTGSTMYTVELLKSYYDFKHCLVVCGINGAKYNWHQVEIPKFSYEKSHMIGSRINRRGRFVVEGNDEKYEDLLKEHDEFYLIINIESLRDERISKQLQEMIFDGRIGVVVVDEIHKCKGHTSAQGKAIQKLRPRFRFGLTGTPVHNKPLDVYNLLMWIGGEYRTFSDFRNEHCIEVPQQVVMNRRIVNFSKWVYKDLKPLHDQLSNIMIRRTVELLNLPEPIFKTEFVDLYPQQQKAYAIEKESILEKLGSQTTLDNMHEKNPAVLFTRLRQIVSAPSTFGINQDAKKDRMIELCEELVESGKSVVIFTWFNETTFAYSKELRDKFPGNVVVVDKNTKNVQNAVTEFQEGSQQILIGNLTKLGTSFTITKADYVIFIEKHVVWSDYKQAYMRVWRQGQTKTVVIIDIMAKDTIDERLEYLVQLGRSHSQQIVDGDEDISFYLDKYNLEDMI